MGVILLKMLKRQQCLLPEIHKEEKMKKVFSCAALFALSCAATTVLAGGSGLSDMEQLGKRLYNSRELSLNRTQSCATCHHKMAGFADPTNARDPYNTFVSLGDNLVDKGGRNAPTAAYCGFSPILDVKADGKWQGGMFWDGRATGETLGDPLAEQAQGPPLNPVEMNMPDVETIIARIEASRIAPLFEKVFGPDAFADVDQAYNNLAAAIASYERSTEVSPFNSRFDRGELTAQEENGYGLFQDNCARCHSTDIVAGAGGPLFTNYQYVNIGVPTNIALLADEGSVYDGNDLGLGYVVGGENGKFKVPTLRNIAKTAPYSHNGYFPTLYDMVSFHNSRDVEAAGWPAPEISENLNTTDVGNMGLTPEQIDDIVAFLGSLTDSKTMGGGGMSR